MLSLADGEALDGGLFLGHAEGGLVSLGDLLGLLEAVELDVAVGGEVGADTTVGTVGSSAAGDGALDDDVVDHARVDVELGCLSVGLQVEQELAHGLDGLLGPSTLRVLKFLGLAGGADVSRHCTVGESGGRNSSLLNF